MICELCGADVPRLKNVAIEATILSVCGDCARFGDEVAALVAARHAGVDVAPFIGPVKARLGLA